MFKRTSALNIPFRRSHRVENCERTPETTSPSSDTLASSTDSTCRSSNSTLSVDDSSHQLCSVDSDIIPERCSGGKTRQIVPFTLSSSTPPEEIHDTLTSSREQTISLLLESKHPSSIPSILESTMISIARNDISREYHIAVLGPQLNLICNITYQLIHDSQTWESVQLSSPFDEDRKLAAISDPRRRLCFAIFQLYLKHLIEKILDNRHCMQQNLESLNRVRLDELVSSLQSIMVPDHPINAFRLHILCNLKPVYAHMDLILQGPISSYTMLAENVLSFFGSPVPVVTNSVRAEAYGSSSPSPPPYIHPEKASSVLYGQRMELVDTECSYVEKLGIIEHYYKPQLFGANSSREFMSTDTLLDIFHNTDKLLHRNQLFLDKLRDGHDAHDAQSWLKFAQAIHIHAIRSRKEYESYIATYERRMTLLRQLRKDNGSFRRLLAEIEQGPSRHTQTWDELMAEPFQRIPRYLLMIDRLIKHWSFTDDSDSSESYSLALTYLQRAYTVFDATAKVSGYEYWQKEEMMNCLSVEMKCPKDTFIEDNDILTSFKAQEIGLVNTLSYGQSDSTHDLEFLVTKRKLVLIDANSSTRRYVTSVSWNGLQLLRNPEFPELLFIQQNGYLQDDVGYWVMQPIHAFKFFDTKSQEKFTALFSYLETATRTKIKNQVTYIGTSSQGQKVLTHVFRGDKSYKHSKSYERSKMAIIYRSSNSKNASIDLSTFENSDRKFGLTGTLEHQEDGCAKISINDKLSKKQNSGRLTKDLVQNECAQWVQIKDCAEVLLNQAVYASQNVFDLDGEDQRKALHLAIISSAKRIYKKAAQKKSRFVELLKLKTRSTIRTEDDLESKHTMVDDLDDLVYSLDDVENAGQRDNLKNTILGRINKELKNISGTKFEA